MMKKAQMYIQLNQERYNFVTNIKSHEKPVLLYL